MMKNILCLLGFHKWVMTVPNCKRECVHCGKKQKILPGHGGGEAWCWLDDNERNDL